MIFMKVFTAVVVILKQVKISIVKCWISVCYPLKAYE